MIKCLMSSEFPCFTHPRIRGRDLPMPRSQPEFPLSVSCSLAAGTVVWFVGSGSWTGYGGNGLEFGSFV